MRKKFKRKEEKERIHGRWGFDQDLEVWIRKDTSSKPGCESAEAGNRDEYFEAVRTSLTKKMWCLMQKHGGK